MRPMAPAGHKNAPPLHPPTQNPTNVPGTVLPGQGGKMGPPQAHALKGGAFHHPPGQAARETSELTDTVSLTEREIRENGITYNVYADPRGADRPWEIDPLPLLISAGEWEEVEAAIAQRAELLNRVLADIYGPQQLLRSGAIPPAIVFGHRGFLHQAQGIRPPGGVHLFQYAADLARSPDGHWWVVGDRTQAPSGAGYALENRLVHSRGFPPMFRELPVPRLAPLFAAMRQSLPRWAAPGRLCAWGGGASRSSCLRSPPGGWASPRPLRTHGGSSTRSSSSHWTAAAASVRCSAPTLTSTTAPSCRPTSATRRSATSRR